MIATRLIVNLLCSKNKDLISTCILTCLSQVFVETVIEKLFEIASLLLCH